MRKPSDQELRKWGTTKIPCKKCGIPKLAKDYYFQFGNPGQPCMTCRIRRACDLQRVENLEDRKAYRKSRQATAIAFVQAEKQKPCIDCGLVFHHVCMDFDHLKNKHRSVSHMAMLGHGIKTIEREIQKCELVCVLCHRTRTYLRQQEARLDREPPTTFHGKRAAYYSRRKKELIQSLKASNHCAWCKEWFLPWQMDFDHLEDKRFNVGGMIYGGRTLTLLFEEIGKCRLLCAACHRLITRLGEDHEVTRSAFRDDVLPQRLRGNSSSNPEQDGPHRWKQ